MIEFGVLAIMALASYKMRPAPALPGQGNKKAERPSTAKLSYLLPP